MSRRDCLAILLSFFVLSEGSEFGTNTLMTSCTEGWDDLMGVEGAEFMISSSDMI